MDRETNTPLDQNQKPIRRARIPADKSAVWEDGSGDEARPRTRTSVPRKPRPASETPGNPRRKVNQRKGKVTRGR